MKKLILILLTPFLFACAVNEKGQKTYVGPSFGVNVGYSGVTVGVAVAGPNPASVAPLAPPAPIPVVAVTPSPK